MATGIPRRVAEDDWYNGMLIPKDSTVFLPIWAVHHAEGQGYNDSYGFNPDRYIDHHKLANDYAGSADYSQRGKSRSLTITRSILTRRRNQDHYGYGAGRRMCPGVHLAERNQWRIVAKLLWAFEILEPTDPTTGKTMPLDVDAYSNGLLHAPLPFKVTFKPRSRAHVETISRAFKGAMEDLKPFE